LCALELIGHIEKGVLGFLLHDIVDDFVQRVFEVVLGEVIFH
jgi:hypothetical protein